MCAKCDQLDRQITYVVRMIDPDLEPLSLGLLRAALADLKAEKAAFKCADGGWK